MANATKLNKANQERISDDNWAERRLAIIETGGLDALLERIEGHITEQRAELASVTAGHTIVRNDANIPANIKALLEISVPAKVAGLLASIEVLNIRKADMIQLSEAGII